MKGGGVLVRNDRGFTLIELISVLIIMGIVVSAVAIKADWLNRGAKEKAIQLAIAELNTRERMVWNDLRLTDLSDDLFDSYLFQYMINQDHYNLGSSTSWRSGPGPGGGTIQTNAGSTSLARTSASRASPGHWK